MGDFASVSLNFIRGSRNKFADNNSDGTGGKRGREEYLYVGGCLQSPGGVDSAGKQPFGKRIDHWLKIARVLSMGEDFGGKRRCHRENCCCPSCHCQE